MKPDHECSAPAASPESAVSPRFDALLRLAKRLGGFSICGVATVDGAAQSLQLVPRQPEAIAQALQPLLSRARLGATALRIVHANETSEGLGSFLGYPLRIGTGPCIGVFYLADPQPRAVDTALELCLQDIADSAAQLIAQEQSDATLQVEASRMALAIQGSGIGIWDRDLNSGNIHYSTAWKAMLGYTEDEVSTFIEDSYARVHPDELSMVMQAMQAHIAGQTEQYQVEHRLRCRDGSYKWVCSRGQVVSRDAEGNALRMLGITNDISNLRALSERLRHSVELITGLTDQVPGVVFQYRSQPDGSGCFTYVSAGVRDIFEITQEQLLHDPQLVEERVHPDDLAVYKAARKHAGRKVCTWHLEYRVELPNQGLRWRLGEARPQRAEDGSITWHGVVTDITERKRFERELQEYASLDALTQLSNRRVFMAYLGDELARVQRGVVSVSSLLMCDLDHFKQVNDQWGHGIGDRALRHFSDILRSQLRTSDLAGRVGGEEFAVVLSGAGTFPARDFACHVQHALACQPLRIEGQDINLTLSIGITQLTAQDPGPDTALGRADSALYRAKQNGRNRVESR